ncbi:hypothetical protein VINI7043_17059 [Vibrio nigripulchritudo ATCC 27043]|uniref:DUF4145 domain-containing protein n=1 Tax=Vibrio nigripulchritudo TaxID=28173 RepID=UPI00021C4230|nr:DUF4145 domain-containing protein [Vibrio nigripulchritudo]EGU56582.1 hypothetical protein VINI7043_17059 [Vibrio nigripulchritudo ATCC 27043]
MTFNSFYDLTTAKPFNPGLYHHLLAMICSGCQRGIIAEFLSSNGQVDFHADKFGNLKEFREILNGHIDTYPKVTTTSQLEHLPDNIKNFYEQALKSHKSGLYDAAAIMARKTLEVATKELSPDHKDLTLYKRIEKLYEEHTVTKVLKEWAHIIREEGNGAAHEEEPISENESEELTSFTTMFLNYTFTMPEMIELKKQQPN